MWTPWVSSRGVCATTTLSDVADVGNIKTLSAKSIKDAFDAVLAGNPKFANAKRVDFHEEIGDGAVSVAILASAHAIITWDGAGRFTLKIMTLGEEYLPIPPSCLDRNCRCVFAQAPLLRPCVGT